jgi:hypothetical protein
VMYSTDEVAELEFQAVRMELDRLNVTPAYSTPPSYLGLLVVRAAEAAATPRELGTVVRMVRGWLGMQCPADYLARFRELVADKPFAPSSCLGAVC